jgi:hypothetical protein
MKIQIKILLTVFAEQYKLLSLYDNISALEDRQRIASLFEQAHYELKREVTEGAVINACIEGRTVLFVVSGKRGGSGLALQIGQAKRVGRRPSFRRA